MFPSRRHLHALSRDPRVLKRLIFILAGAFFLSALLLGLNRPRAGDTGSILDRRVEGIRAVVTADPLDPWALVRLLREDAEEVAGWSRLAGAESSKLTGSLVEGVPEWLRGGVLTEPDQKVLVAWHLALIQPERVPSVLRELEDWQFPAAPSLPATLSGDLKRVVLDYKGALSEYEAAGQYPDGEEARRRAVDLAMSRGWSGVVDRLMAQPSWHEAVHSVDDGLSNIVAQEQMDIPVIFRGMWNHTVNLLGFTDYLILSVLTAAVWFVSLHKACRIPRRQWWWSLAGIPLGMFSTVLTLVLMSLQESRQGLTDSPSAGPALVFQIASVGLREEFSKILCALPLLILLLLRRGTPGQALLAASSVGLGFALEENIGYYHASGGSAVLSRFVTATFAHIGMTGLIGHALFQFLRYPRNYGAPFLATFVSIVLFHGFYNFSLSGFDNPFSRELEYLTPFMIAGLCWYYFQVVRQEQDRAPLMLSAEAVFLTGVTVVMGTLLNFLVWETGWEEALHTFVPTALTSVMFGWLFHHFLKEA